MTRRGRGGFLREPTSGDLLQGAPAHSARKAYKPMSIYRLTGKAGLVSERRGSTGEGDNKRDWVMRSQDVEIAPLVVTTINLPDGSTGYVPGTDLDVAVDVTAKGGYLNALVRGDWPKPVPLHAAGSAARASA